MKARSDAHANNIEKRGSVPKSRSRKRDDGISIGPVALAFFLFVVVGSALFNILQTATSGN
eukprot:CAMPEP_0168313168 /NCGR_PEP_ID=MMETSP0210-20121227/177_1 /TAXON_ID=40633 /ORGANISM="Condylostoma magnum, Strain COL2" /LENGTH=60 /DNA_ID=CAMNT_0008266467 /DNA_START=35 /DNA_END=217 /DNA_ORIENTATION=+